MGTSPPPTSQRALADYAGVQGLWTILEPAARPVKLEALAKKRLAVDASIWIYQFLKAVRDKEGQALRNSHIVGFFRRICKLLFFGIKPVFVFDGGAPTLKRQTLAARAQRREGRKEDASRTAGKMLALQMRRRAAMEAERTRMGVADVTAGGDEIGEDVVYFGEIDMRPEERKRRFRKTDQYHLPTLEIPLEKMAAPNDTRILTEQELEEYAKDYHMLEDLSHYDFSKIDFDSDHFRTLPPAEQYSILNAARLRSRLRMGYTKEQLDEMFPDRLAFSRFQIQRLKERNDYTQRLMNLNGMNDVGAQRVAGEKGREYYLVKNEGAEGGWVLGISGPGGVREKPVLVDLEERIEEEGEDEEFEDVPLEVSQEEEPPEVLKTLTTKREQVPTRLPFKAIPKLDEGLFVVDEEEGDEFEGEMAVDSEEDDADLQAAIRLSMQERGPQPIDLDSLRSDSPIATSITNENELQQAIAVSIAHDISRPTTSDSKGSEMLDAVARSLDDMEPIPSTSHVHVSMRPAPQTSVSDNGRGKAPSLSIEPLGRGLQKGGFETNVARDDISATATITVTESRSKAANLLGRSIFRKKEPAAPPIVTSPPPQIAPASRETFDIVPEPALDVVLEENVREASPVPVPTTEFPSPSPPPRRSATPIAIEELEESEMEDISIEMLQDIAMPPTIEIPQPSQETVDQSRPLSSQSQRSHATQSTQDDHDHYPSDDEDEDLLAQLTAEAEEHARFTSAINPKASSRAEDYSLYSEEDFEREMRLLRNQQKRDRRDADEVNQLMVVECQQLLRLFGLPFITAPMEAEAQCAELVKLGLVDGIVTDDSDIFLFGGTRVYKNMFNQGKFVECYLASDLERDYNLDRQKFINLAHLLGSDYAEGLPHVGPVNALELLSEFPGANGLEEFREWWVAVQQGRFPVKDPSDNEFRRKFKKNSTKIFLPTDFPNRSIDQAYLMPQVDHDPQGFVWGRPDLDALRTFLMSQIGWSKERTDEVLVPVIRDMNLRQIEGGQTNLTDFFEGNVGSGTFAPRKKVMHRSKRLSKAMASLKRTEDEDDVKEIAPRKMATKRRRPAAMEVIKVESDDEERNMENKDISSNEDSSSEEEDQLKRKADRGGRSGQSKKRKIRKPYPG